MEEDSVKYQEMQLEIRVSDDMQAMTPIERRRTRVVYSRRAPISKAEWTRGHRLLLAQALAIAFYSPITGEV